MIRVCVLNVAQGVLAPRVVELDESDWVFAVSACDIVDAKNAPPVIGGQTVGWTSLRLGGNNLS